MAKPTQRRSNHHPHHLTHQNPTQQQSFHLSLTSTHQPANGGKATTTPITNPTFPTKQPPHHQQRINHHPTVKQPPPPSLCSLSLPSISPNSTSPTPNLHHRQGFLIGLYS
ncbi:Uncharacterized protein Fot_54569 [Forsythia ovata]|uniref:Uncharacterized protein n=1 Tax=Forsythia ovata TaxID=205694 RepID=A0ABD1P7H2_9LAMI